MKDYGTLDWFMDEYGKTGEDPWGLNWRPSQFLRYARVLELVDRIPAPIAGVMDIGCATGVFTHLLSRHLPSVRWLLGVDFVEEAVARARTKFPDIQFSCESILSVADKYRARADLVTCLEVLYYLNEDDQRRALLSIRQTLSPTGHAVFSSYISKPPHFTPERFEQLIGSEFEILRTEILHLKPVSLVEKAAGKCGVARSAGFRWPMKAIGGAERASRLLGRCAASHTLLLVKAKSA